MAPYEGAVAIWRVSSRRLEDHIRELCAKVGHLHGAELHKTLAELRTALNEHSRRLRKIAAEGLLRDQTQSERRKR